MALPTVVAVTSPTAGSIPKASPIPPTDANPGTGYRRRVPELSRFVSTVARQSILEPFRSGRLRDQGWPHGLRAIVALSYAMFGLAAVLLVASGAIRRTGALTTQGVSVIALPDSAVPPLVLLLSFALAIFLTAALNTTWWLKLIALLITVAVLGNWVVSGSVATPRLVGGSAVLMVGLAGFVIVRWRRRFAWWDFATIWVLIGAVLSIGMAMSRAGRGIGGDFTALLLQALATTVGMFALPAAMTVGAATAEITVRVTVSATDYARRWRAGRAAYLILAVVAASRLMQLGVDYARSGRLVAGRSELLTAAVLLGLFAGFGLLVRRLGQRLQRQISAASPSVADPDEFAHRHDRAGLCGSDP